MTEVTEYAARKNKVVDGTGVFEMFLGDNNQEALRRAVYDNVWVPDDEYEDHEYNERDAYQVAYGEAMRVTPW